MLFGRPAVHYARGVQRDSYARIDLRGQGEASQTGTTGMLPAVESCFYQLFMLFPASKKQRSR